jgi:hypothetical protein
VSKAAKRGWLERLGLKADEPRPEDWVEVATGQVDSKTGSSYADEMVNQLMSAGIEAYAKPYVLPDDSSLVKPRRPGCRMTAAGQADRPPTSCGGACWSGFSR